MNYASEPQSLPRLTFTQQQFVTFVETFIITTLYDLMRHCSFDDRMLILSENAKWLCARTLATAFVPPAAFASPVTARSLNYCVRTSVSAKYGIMFAVRKAGINVFRPGTRCRKRSASAVVVCDLWYGEYRHPTAKNDLRVVSPATTESFGNQVFQLGDPVRGRWSDGCRKRSCKRMVQSRRR